MAIAAVRLADRYQFGRTLGSGTVTEVLAGRDLLLKRPVAIKVLHPWVADDPALVAQFELAVRESAAINHPNAAAIFDIGAHGGVRYVVTELVRGRTLADVLGAGRRLSAAESVSLARGVGAALGAAHERGLVHGDLTPGNIMLTDDGGVKVTDFGIARALGASGASSTAAARYAAPEAGQGPPPDARSDLYALGACLHECLTGRPPQAGGQQPSPELPEELANVLGRLLAEDPDDRYQSAAELGDALGPALELVHVAPAAAPLAAPRATVEVVPAWRPAPPRWRRWGLLAGLAVLLVALTGLWLAPGRGPAGLFAGRQNQPGGGEVVVPQVEGAPSDQARALLESLGLRVKEARQAHGTIPAGDAIRTEPSAGVSLARGRTVLLLVSTGPTQSPVPSVLEQQGAPAAAGLVDAGFPTTVVQVPSDRPAGTVLAQDPPAGQRLGPGERVVLTVAAGPTGSGGTPGTGAPAPPGGGRGTSGPGTDGAGTGTGTPPATGPATAPPTPTTAPPTTVPTTTTPPTTTEPDDQPGKDKGGGNGGGHGNGNGGGKGKGK